MAPKRAGKAANKRGSDQDTNDPGYAAKRARNNEAVKKSREKAKQVAEQTTKRVKKLREDNKLLEGKIDEQKKTKKFLKDLFLQQTTSKMKSPTKEQWDLLNDEESSEHEESDQSDASSDAESSNLESPSHSVVSSSKRRRK